MLDLLIEQALERLRPERFTAVAGFPGFRRALAELFEQAPSAALPADLADLEEDVERNLKARGLGLRHARLRRARRRFRDGGCAGERHSSTGSLRCPPPKPTWSWRWASAPASPSRFRTGRARRLFASFCCRPGSLEQRLSSAIRSARRTGFSAATIEREVEEIARRILKYDARGTAFREMGIVLRSRDPYAGVVETTLARFGIPARFYFHRPLGSHPALTFLVNVMRAMLAGWDHATLLAAVRMPVSGLGATLLETSSISRGATSFRLSGCLCLQD